MEKEALESRILESLELIRPYLIADGGDISFIELTNDNVVKVRLLGACQSCAYNIQTLKAGVEQTVKKMIPEIKEVVAVEDEDLFA